MNPEDPYLTYYRAQTGGGIASVYMGAPYQRGHGIGSFLGGLFRSVIPLLKSGATTLGKEALRSGVGFLGDIAAGTANPKAIANERFRQLTDTLKRKADERLERALTGGGAAYKKRARVTPQSLAKLLAVQTQKGRKKKVGARKKKSDSYRDIFV